MKTYSVYGIVKPYMVRIFQYSKRLHDMHDLVKFSTPPSNNGGEFDQACWSVHNK